MEITIKKLADNVFKELGPGYSEVIYRKALEIELRDAAFDYQCEVPIPVIYKGKPIGTGYADIIIYPSDGGCYIIELKAVITDQPQQWEMQLDRYICGCRIGRSGTVGGMVINFNQKQNTVRIISKK